MKTTVVFALVLLLVGSGVAAWGMQDEPLQIDTTKFMKRKLDNSRDIVSGLATEDFDLIARSAQDIMLLSQESGWNVIQSEAYLRMSSEFRTSAERLRDKAHEKNLDGTTLAFFEVTLSCVRCHKYIRQNRPK